MRELRREELCEMVRSRAGLGVSALSELPGLRNQSQRIDEEIARLAVEESTRLLLSEPLDVIGEWDVMKLDFDWKVNGSGEYTGLSFLPEDYLRFVSFRLTGWDHPVNEIIHPGSPRHALLECGFEELAGSVESPAVYLHNSVGGRMIEVRSASTYGQGHSGAYLRRPIWKDDLLTLPEGIVGAMLSAVAKQFS